MKSILTPCPTCFEKAVKVEYGPSVTEGKKTVSLIVHPCTHCGKLSDFDKLLSDEIERTNGQKFNDA